MLFGYATSNGPLVVAAGGYQFQYHARSANSSLEPLQLLLYRGLKDLYPLTPSMLTMIKAFNLGLGLEERDRLIFPHIPPPVITPYYSTFIYFLTLSYGQSTR